ncbi:hypothetical protein CIW82_18150 [Acetobacter tropicalis]|uniref:Uncharacterized protein n=1 Tax=Acetobacter tropicalis TaxID=104102 RepID=A0A291PLJ0_9PROT|nr:hypothetical protein CIW82_18150 [Acetobacter tropicalis]
MFAVPEPGRRQLFETVKRGEINLLKTWSGYQMLSAVSYLLNGPWPGAVQEAIITGWKHIRCLVPGFDSVLPSIFTG